MDDKPVKKSMCARAVVKAEKEYEEILASNGDLSKFKLRRLPLLVVKRLEVLPVFDHILGSEPMIYEVNEKMFFGETDWISDEFRKSVQKGAYADAAELLRSHPSIESAVEDRSSESASLRCTINDTALLDYASRYGFSKEKAMALVNRHGHNRFKPKDVIFVRGRIEKILTTW